MEQVSGPVVAVALVLSAVFVPCAFISGITGQFFRQFALTIAVSTVISRVQLPDAQSRPCRPPVEAEGPRRLPALPRPIVALLVAGWAGYC